MTLKIIGSGFGRTGTMTTKTALEALGLGPCHHMTEIMHHPEQLDHWKKLSAGDDVDLETVYRGYVSQVDWPGAHIFHEAAVAFPDAKVIHTERPEEDWWRSFNGTIGKFFRIYRQFDLPPHFVDLFDTMSGYFVKTDFPDLTDRDAVIATYRRRNARVREVIPADRLLVFTVADGWEPLCGFLGVPVPETRSPTSIRATSSGRISAASRRRKPRPPDGKRNRTPPGRRPRRWRSESPSGSGAFPASRGRVAHFRGEPGGGQHRKRAVNWVRQVSHRPA